MDVYEALQEKLNEHAMGAPKREEFLEILRILFTPEEAELAVHLPFTPQRAREIAATLGRPLDEVIRLCDQMAAKAILYSLDVRGNKLYMLFPTAPGLFEFPFMKNAVSPGSIPNVDFGQLGKLWWKYHKDGWGLEMSNSPTAAARVIPVQQSITPDLQVFAYEEVATFVKNARYVAVSECPCRTTQKNCDAPTDVCMAFDFGAKFLTAQGAARMVTTEEALATLKRAEDAGLVHCASNTRDTVEYICNCCPCCCGILGVITRLTGAISKPQSNFYSTVIADACTVCGICVDRCPTKAITLGDVAVIDTDKCIGCGLCVSGCGFDAMALVRKADSVEPPVDNRELYATLAMEKGRAEGFLANLVAS